MVTEAALVQLSEPPLTLGSVGSVRSRRTVAVGDQAEVLPAPSTAADCTSVSPSAETVSVAPEAAGDQLAPASLEVWKR